MRALVLLALGATLAGAHPNPLAVVTSRRAVCVEACAARIAVECAPTDTACGKAIRRACMHAAPLVVCPHGAVGVPGPTGPPGAPGVCEAPCTDGAPGAAGPPGSAGPIGVAGPMGAPGPTGASGAPGMPGPGGARGATGPTGSTGPAGGAALAIVVRQAVVTQERPEQATRIAATAPCALGELALSGGLHVDVRAPDDAGRFVQLEAGPVVDAGTVPAWFGAIGITQRFTNGGALTLTVTALCATLAPPA
jgi:hypothetical protein